VKCNKKLLKSIEELFGDYEKVVKKAEKDGLLKRNTVNTYLYHPRNFIKWCNDEFEPGAKNK
jgi:hypothetical protein